MLPTVFSDLAIRAPAGIGIQESRLDLIQTGPIAMILQTPDSAFRRSPASSRWAYHGRAGGTVRKSLLNSRVRVCCLGLIHSLDIDLSPYLPLERVLSPQVRTVPTGIAQPEQHRH